MRHQRHLAAFSAGLVEWWAKQPGDILCVFTLHSMLLAIQLLCPTCRRTTMTFVLKREYSRKWAPRVQFPFVDLIESGWVPNWNELRQANQTKTLLFAVARLGAMYVCLTGVQVAIGQLSFSLFLSISKTTSINLHLSGTFGVCVCVCVCTDLWLLHKDWIESLNDWPQDFDCNRLLLEPLLGTALTVNIFNYLPLVEFYSLELSQLSPNFGPSVNLLPLLN